MSVFENKDYKAFINEWIARQPNSGRGELQKIAKSLRVHPTLISHVFRGPKDLTLEQSALLAKYINLTPLEGDYFLLLVQRAKAGNPELQQIFDRQIVEIRRKSSDLIFRVKNEGQMSEDAKRIFYSNWHYSAVRLATSLESTRTPALISKHLGLSLRVVRNALQFLLSNGLVDYDGKHYSMGPSLTHLESQSEMIPIHHLNWRRRAMDRYYFLNSRELVFSAPLSISKKQADDFRERLVDLIKTLGEKTKSSEAEELRCFNIDWVELSDLRESD